MFDFLTPDALTALAKVIMIDLVLAGDNAIVIGLAAIVIGEVLGRLTPGKLTGFKSRLVSAVAGSVVYFLIRAIVLQLGMDANDMKLLSAVIVALALCIPVVWEKFKLRTSYTKGGEADA